MTALIEAVFRDVLGDNALDVTGEANGYGFRLGIRIPNRDPFGLNAHGRMTFFSTPFYGIGEAINAARDNTIVRRVVRLVFYLLCLYCLVFLVQFKSLTYGPFAAVAVAGAMCIANALSIWFAFGQMVWADRGRPWRQWHACEHRLAMLLTAGRLPNAPAMSSGRQVSVLCGVSDGMLGTFVLMSCGLALWYGPWFLPALVSSFLAWRQVAAMKRKRHLPRNRLTELWTALALPAYGLASLVEHVLALRDPEPYRIRQTLESFAEFLREHPEFAERLQRQP